MTFPFLKRRSRTTGKERDGSKLMVLHRDGGIEHKSFHDLPLFLDSGDLLLINNSKVFLPVLPDTSKWRTARNPARQRNLAGTLEDHDQRKIYRQCLPGRRGDRFHYGGKTASFGKTTDVRKLLWENGQMPLPPYIRRPADETTENGTRQYTQRSKARSRRNSRPALYREGLLDTIASRG